MTGEPERKLLSDVETYGWHVIQVAEDDVGPGFSYSIGLYHTLRHPEMIVVGLSPESSHELINLVGEEIRGGRVFAAGGVYKGLLEAYAATFRAVPARQYASYLGFANRFYADRSFPVLQLVYPDREGRWPWSSDVSDAFGRSSRSLPMTSCRPRGA